MQAFNITSPASQKDQFLVDFMNHASALKSYARNLTGEAFAADDLYQETALRAFRSRNSFRPGTNMKAWLTTIMRNSFINDFRSKSKKRKVMDSNVEQKQAESQSLKFERNLAESTLTLETVMAMINRLDDVYKTPFLMAYKGYSYKEISDHMQRPLGTIKSLIFQARQQLKNELKTVQITSFSDKAA